MPPFPFKRGAGGGRGVSLLAKIPVVPQFKTDPDTDEESFESLKSFSGMLFGSEDERRGITRDQNGISYTYSKSSLENHAPIGQIEDIEIHSTTTNVLRGWLYHPDAGIAAQHQNRSQYVVLFLSGSGGPAEEYSQAVGRFYAGRGIKTLAVNYRGYGNSGSKFRHGHGRGGTPTESGLYDDAYYMYLYLTKTKGFSGSHVIVHGYSLGGAIAANLVRTLVRRKKTLRGLVLQSPMVSAPKAAADDDMATPMKAPAALLTWSLFGSFDTIGCMKEIAKKRPNLKLCLTSGDKSYGDQLDISAPLFMSKKTFLQQVQSMGFTTVNHARASANHVQASAHMSAADHNGNISTMWT